MKLLTDINGKDVDKIINDLKSHNFDGTFSQRQCYCIGAQAQLQSCEKEFKRMKIKLMDTHLKAGEKAIQKIYDAHQAERERIIAEIEKYSDCKDPNCDMALMIITDWASLKSRIRDGL